MKKAADPNTVEGKAVALAMSAVMAWSQAGYVPTALAEEANESGYESIADGVEPQEAPQQSEASGGVVAEQGEADEVGETTESSETSKSAEAAEGEGTVDEGASPDEADGTATDAATGEDADSDASAGEDDPTADEDTAAGDADSIDATEQDPAETGASAAQTDAEGASDDASQQGDAAADALAATPSLTSLDDGIMLADNASTYSVYVYVHEQGYYTSGEKINGTGSWVTIGKLSGVSMSAPSSGSTSYVTSGDDWDAVMAAIKDGSAFSYYTGFNKTFGLGEVDWTGHGLKVDGGATDYSDEAAGSVRTWHLDGVIVRGKVTVNYHLLTNGVETGTATVESSGVKIGTTMDFTTSDYTDKYASQGYTFDTTKDNTTSITVAQGDGNVADLYYNKVTTSSCTLKYVTYDANHNEVELKTPDTVSDLTVGNTLTKTAADAPTIAGYTLNEGASSLSSAIVADADSNTITFVYDKKTDLSYTVNYYWGTEDSDDPTLVSTQTVPNQTFGDQVTVMPTGVPNGYTLVAGQADGKTIAIGDDAANPNVVNFYCYKNVTLTATSGESTKYDGSERTVSGYTATASAEGDATVTGIAFTGLTATGSGTDAGTYAVSFAKGDDTEVVPTTDLVGMIDDSDKYVVSDAETGTFTITQRNVTLKSESLSKTYDGEALQAGGTVTVVQTDENDDDWVAGETAAYTFSGSRIEAGTTTEGNTFTVDWSNAGTTAKADNYNITYQYGSLTVKDNDAEYVVHITQTGGATKTYNGSEQSITTGWTISNIEQSTSGVELKASDISFTGTDADLVIKGTDAGTYKTAKTGDDFAALFVVTDTTKYPNVKFVVDTPATLEITPVTSAVVVKVAGNTATEVYDGTEKSVSGWTLSGITDTTGLYTSSDFKLADGVEASASGTDADSYPMGLTAASFVNVNSKNFTNVTFEVEDGGLTITKRGVPTNPSDPDDANRVKIEANDVTATYDGNAHTASEGAAGVSVDGNFVPLASGHKISTATVSGSQTNAGSSSLTPESVTIVDAQGNDVTKNYELTLVNGTVSVAQATLTITANDASATYDGTVHGGNGYTAGDPATGQKLDSVTVSGGKVLAGTYEGELVPSAAKIVDADGNDVTSNYAITYTAGTLTIAQRSATVTPDSWTTTYDGTEKHLTGVKGSNLVASDTIVSATIDGSGTDAATYSATVKDGSVKILDANNNDVTSCYSFTYGTGTLTISPAPLEVTTGSATKVYDGTPLTSDTAEVTGAVEGKGVTVVATGKQTDVNVGSPATNTYTIDYGTDKASNYSVTESLGTLTVTAQPINPGDPSYPVDEQGNPAGVTVSDPTDATYDGDEHKFVPEVKDKDGNPLTEGEDYTVTYGTDNFTDAGTVTVTVTGKGNYSGTVAKTYAINPAPLEVTTGSATKTYDGEALTDPTVTFKGLVGDETLDASAVGSQTEVGGESGNNTVRVDWESEGTTAKQGNYALTVVPGTLTVTAQSINPNDPSYPTDEQGNPAGVMVSDPSDVTYDGDEHKFVPEVKDKDGSPLTEGVDYEVTYGTDDFTDAGTVTVTVTGKGNYSGTVVKTYKINRRPVTFTSASASKTYDGEALTNGTVDLTAGTMAEGESFTFDVTGSQTNVGSSDNAFTATPAEGTDADNYQLTLSFGSLKVVAQGINPDDETYGQVNVTTPADVTYDGGEHKFVPEVTDKDGNPLTEGEDYTVTYDTDDFTDAGTVTVTVEGAGNYSGKVVTEYKITQRPVTVQSASASKVYDGKALTSESASVASGSFVEGEEPTYTFSGTQTEVGGEAGNNAFTFAFASEDVAGNYNVTTVPGTLTVTAQPINPGDPSYPVDEQGNPAGVTVSQPEDTTYDGTSQEQPVEVKDKAGNPLTEGVDYTVAYSEDTTNAGTVKVTVTGIGNYSGIVIKTYKISPAPLEVTTGSATKTYDGTPLTCDEVTVTGLVNGETLVVTAEGSQTEVGGESGNNAAAFSWESEGTTAKQGNYALTVTPGTLTVTAQSITPGADPADPDPAYQGVTVSDPEDVTYDGNEHKWVPEVADKDGNPLTEGVDYTVTYDTDDFTNTGTVKVTIEGKGNYSGTVTKTYTIDPREVTVTAGSASKSYDGTPLTSDEVTVSGEGFVKGDEPTYAFTGSQTDAGTSENGVTVKFGDGQTAKNYKVTVVPGTLTVTAQSINPADPSYPKDAQGNPAGVTSNDPVDVTYDGNEHKFVPVVKDKDGNVLVEGKDYKVTYSTDDFVNTGTITVTITGIGNYAGTVTKSYKINPAPTPSVIAKTGDDTPSPTPVAAAGMSLLAMAALFFKRAFGRRED